LFINVVSVVTIYTVISAPSLSRVEIPFRVDPIWYRPHLYGITLNADTMASFILDSSFVILLQHRPSEDESNFIININISSINIINIINIIRIISIIHIVDIVSIINIIDIINIIGIINIINIFNVVNIINIINIINIFNVVNIINIIK